MHAARQRTAADQRHQRRVALLHAVTCEHQGNVWIGLDQLAHRANQRCMVVFGLERGGHADDERFAGQTQLLT